MLDMQWINLPGQNLLNRETSFFTRFNEFLIHVLLLLSSLFILLWIIGKLIRISSFDRKHGSVARRFLVTEICPELELWRFEHQLLTILLILSCSKRS